MTEPSPAAKRRSAVRFDATPVEVERQGDWDVVLAYADAPGARAVTGADGGGDRPGPWLVDLSHRPRWDYQDRRIDERRPFGLHVPATPGEVSVADGLMISRMNGTQALIWHVGPEPPPKTPTDVSYTDTTDSHCWLAVVGAAAPGVMEHGSNLDLFPPEREPAFLAQGLVLRVPCQVVTAARDGVLITVSRGYAQTFTETLLHSAARTGLRPGGERVFTHWWPPVQGGLGHRRNP